MITRDHLIKPKPDLSSESYIYDLPYGGASKLSKIVVSLPPLDTADSFFLPPPNQPPNHESLPESEEDEEERLVNSACGRDRGGARPGNWPVGYPGTLAIPAGSSVTTGIFCCWLRTLLSIIPAPSINANKTPPKTAERAADAGPCRI
ncbi:hypothetical protein SDJN02_17995, partial [Cucurbita argyrosperma subsp. argyrosperma]